MLSKLKFAIATLLGFSAACSSVRTAPRAEEKRDPVAPEVQSDMADTMRVVVMYGPRAPMPPAEEVERMKREYEAQQMDSLGPVHESPADDMPVLPDPKRE